jgi:hypothetical protein
MNAITSLTQYIPMPKIAALEAVKHLVVKVTWSEGIRSGRTDIVDLSPMINSLKLYRPLRNDEDLFRAARLIEGGRIVAWNEQVDMAADSVEALAEETMTGKDLKDFLRTYDLTHQEAAVQLGRSRRQIENYLSNSEPIPRVVVLACFGLVARKRLREPVNQNIPQAEDSVGQMKLSIVS